MARRRGVMSAVKTVLRVGGVILMAAGLMFLPMGDYVFSKRDLSRFHNWADYGAFTSLGIPVILLGLVAFGVSFLIRGDLID